MKQAINERWMKSIHGCLTDVYKASVIRSTGLDHEGMESVYP
jgi:hypothetical protein